MDWSDWLPEGDTVESSVWAVDNPPDNALTLSNPTIDDDGIPNVTLSGGTVGATYRLRNRITTDNGLIDDRSFFVRISER
jgi:hypothetical protein